MEAVAGVRGRAQCRILNVEYIVTRHTACGGYDVAVCGTVEAVAGARGRAHCGILDAEYIVMGHPVCGGWPGRIGRSVAGWGGVGKWVNR